MADILARGGTEIVSDLRGYFSHSIFGRIPFDKSESFLQLDGGIEFETKYRAEKTWSGLLGLGFSSLSGESNKMKYISQVFHLDLGWRARFWNHTYSDFKMGVGPSLYTINDRATNNVAEGMGLNLLGQVGLGGEYCFQRVNGCVSIGVGGALDFGIVGINLAATSLMVNLGVKGKNETQKQPVSEDYMKPNSQSTDEKIAVRPEDDNSKDDGALKKVLDEKSKLLSRIETLENLKYFITVVPPDNVKSFGKPNPVLDAVIRRVSEWVHNVARMSDGKMPCYTVELAVRGLANETRDEKRDVAIADKRASYVISYLSKSRWTDDGRGKKIAPLGKAPMVGGRPILTIQKIDAKEPFSKEEYELLFGDRSLSQHSKAQTELLEWAVLDNPNSRMTIIQYRIKKLDDHGQYHEIPASEFLK